MHRCNSMDIKPTGTLTICVGSKMNMININKEAAEFNAAENCPLKC